MLSAIRSVGRRCGASVGVAGGRVGGVITVAAAVVLKAMKWVSGTQKRRFLLAVLCAAAFFHRGVLATESVPFQKPPCPAGITVSGATKYTNPVSGAKFVYVQTSVGQQTWAYEWNDDDGVMQWNKIGTVAPSVTRAHVAALAQGWPSSYDLHAEFTAGVTPNYAYVACQADATGVPDSCCGHYLCSNGVVTEVTCVSPCMPGNTCVSLPGFYFPPVWKACEGFGDCGGGGPGDPCAPYGGDGDADGTCAQFDCCDSDSAVGATCPACYQFCVQYQDGDGDGCCSNRDCNDGDASVCTFCTGPGPGACDDYGGDADGDGCCANTDIDDSDPLQCAGGPPPPPGGCDDHGGDGDMDGCCGDDDFDDGDPNVCEEPPPGECDRLGGDGDEDGCCADIDVDDGDPEVCEECDNKGGDGDGDGCCDQDDTHPNDPEKGCACMVEGEQQDADGDGCCTADDSDDEDPEKGCQCECDLDPMERLEVIGEKLTGWWPDLEAMAQAASGAGLRQQAGNGQSVWNVQLSLPWGYGPQEIVVPFTLDPEQMPSSLGDPLSWCVSFVRAVLLGYFGIGFALSVLDLVRVL